MKSFFRFILNALSLLLTLFLIFFSVFAIKALSTADDISIEEMTNKNNTVIYDNNNEKIVDIGAELTKYVSYPNINQHMINALICIEDKNFYLHHGINVNRMVMALINNLQNLGFSQGASTINQQLIKNIFLSSEKTLSRKIQEIHLALRLDKVLTKNQVLEVYLNNVLFGGNIYGVEMASLYYFNKKAANLSIADSALLAGLIQLPNFYNPYKNPLESLKRRNLVLDLMYQQDYISLHEYDENKKIAIEQQLSKGTLYQDVSYASSYIDYTLSCLGESNDPFSNESLEIQTYMNKEIQHELYKIITNEYNHFPDNKLKCAIVAIDNQTGGLLGMVGNKSTDKKVLNYATSRIQPGSTIKPILDYAPAIEYLNYSPGTILCDEPFTYQSGEQLKNWDGRHKGYITMRQALAESRNIPSVKLFNQVGHAKSLEFAKNLGIVPISDVYESEAIGGSTYGYSLMSLTNAYVAFANMGAFIKCSPIDKVRTQTDEYINVREKKIVMKPSTAYLVNSMLHDVFKNSTFDLNFTYLCAKTGQTNYDAKTLDQYNIPYDSTKDSLLIAYTKNITIGIWISYDEISSSTYLTQAKVNIARTIMKKIMNKFAEPNQFYEMPNNVISCNVVKDYNSLYLATTPYNNSFIEYFIRGTQPLARRDENPYFSV